MISSAEAASKVLGVEPDSKLSQQFEEVMAKVVGLHVKNRGDTGRWRGDGPEDRVRGGQQGGAHPDGFWGPAGQ